MEVAEQIGCDLGDAHQKGDMRTLMTVSAMTPMPPPISRARQVAG
jgi:hypothetical protein